MATPKQAEKFIQELAWRDYWQRLYTASPEAIWVDIEAYKTGFVASDYADDLPADIARGETGVACIDAFITILLETGYLHNHARMYVAACVVHWRQIKWQTGAKWFLQISLMAIQQAIICHGNGLPVPLPTSPTSSIWKM